MAGGEGFKQGMKRASKPRGQESDNYKTQGAHLIGGGAWDRQVQRESSSFDNAAVAGSRNAENIAAYANASKQATAANGSFSQDTAKGWNSTSRNESNTNKQQEADSNFSGQRIQNNVNYANANRKNNINNNEGFSMGVTNDFVNNAKEHREENTELATQFADRTVDKYIQKNKDTQAINVGALDKAVRGAPINDAAQAQVFSKNTFGDMYSYSRKKLPKWTPASKPKPVEQPDFNAMYGQATKDIKDIDI